MSNIVTAFTILAIAVWVLLAYLLHVALRRWQDDDVVTVGLSFLVYNIALIGIAVLCLK